jgi:hypothetical protein
LRPAALFLSSGFARVTASISARKLSHGTVALISSSGLPFGADRLKPLVKIVEPHLPHSSCPPISSRGITTGVSVFTTELAPKRLQWLRELVPKAGKIAMLINPAANVQEMEAMTRAGLQLLTIKAQADSDLEQAKAPPAEAGPRGKAGAGKRFGEARDRGGIFGDTRRFRATETALFRVSGGKATESQRLFRRRQETGIAQDCVVGYRV